jgi:hypothetical protein
VQPLLDREVARLLTHPDAVRVSGHARQPNAPRPVLDENRTYSVRSHAVSTVKKSHAHIPRAWARRNSPHDGPRRRGAGPQPERLRIDLIVVAPTRMPSLRSSPWIRMQPQLGFSRPRRITSSRSAESSGGRPGQLRR